MTLLWCNNIGPFSTKSANFISPTKISRSDCYAFNPKREYPSSDIEDHFFMISLFVTLQFLITNVGDDKAENFHDF